MILAHAPTNATIRCSKETAYGLMDKYSDDYSVLNKSKVNSFFERLKIEQQHNSQIVEQNMSLQQDCRVLRKAFELYYIDCYIAEKGIRPSDESVKSIVTHYIKEGIDALTGDCR